MRIKQILVFLLNVSVFFGILSLVFAPVSAATSKLLYVSYDGVSTMDVNTINSDGSGSTNLTNSGANEVNGQFGVEWSPDGTKIAFVRSNASGGAPFNIFVMNADGSGLVQLTNDDISGPFNISWSPDSSKIAFVAADTSIPSYIINTINADGTGRTAITSTTVDVCPQWTAGNKILFASFRDGNTEIYSMNPDGSSQTNLTSNAGSDGLILSFCAFSVSPDGSKVAFSSDRDAPGNTYELYSMNVDGSNQTRLTTSNATANNAFPKWSNDGLKIAYGSNNDDLGSGTNGFQIYTMDANGSNQTRLTSSGGNVLVTNSLFGGIEWSPDDSQIAFSSNRNSGIQTFLMNSDGSNQAALVASGVTFNPRWQPATQAGGGTSGGASGGSTSSGSHGELAPTGENQRLYASVGVLLIVLPLAASLTIRRRRTHPTGSR